MHHLKILQSMDFNVTIIFSNKNSKRTRKMISIGALKEVVEGRQDEATIVQVLDVRQLPGEEERWRLNISDGRNSTSLTILDTALNNLIWEGKLNKHAIIQTSITCQVIAAKRVLILRDVRIIKNGSRVNGTFGNPQNMDYEEIENICASCSRKHTCSD